MGTCAGTSISIDESSVGRWYSSKQCAGRRRGAGNGYISTQLTGPTIHRKFVRDFHGGCISWKDCRRGKQAQNQECSTRFGMWPNWSLAKFGSSTCDLAGVGRHNH